MEEIDKNSKFKLLSKSQVLFCYVNRLVPNLPKKENNLKRHIEDSQYELIKYIINYNILTTNIKKKNLLDKFLVELSFYDYLITEIYHKEYISKHQLTCIGTMIIEIRKITYGIIKSL